MVDLRLVHSSKDNDLEMKLKTNNLIESAFQFIAFYVGGDALIEDVYNSSISLMDKQVMNGYAPMSDTYMCDLDLWSKYVDGNLNKKTDEFDIILMNEPLTRIRNIKNSLSDLDDDVYFHLNEQEIFDYATHMFFDNFLQFMDYGKSSVNFPHQIEVLRRKNLEPIVRNFLMNKSKFVFLYNNDNNGSKAVLGLKN